MTNSKSIQMETEARHQYQAFEGVKLLGDSLRSAMSK